MDESNTNSNLNAVQNSVIALKMTGFDAYKTEETKDFEREPISCELPNKSPQKRLKSCIEGQGTEQIVQIQHGEAAFTDTCTEVGDSAAVSFSLYPSAHELPLRPPPAIESNYTQYFAIDFLKPGHDQYIYRHANGLCVIGLASSHVALGDKPQVKAVDFNVGKSSRSDIKVTGKRKKLLEYERSSCLCLLETLLFEGMHPFISRLRGRVHSPYVCHMLGMNTLCGFHGPR
eukprot:Gb_23697 [translate_table: standard]